MQAHLWDGVVPGPGRVHPDPPGPGQADNGQGGREENYSSWPLR